MRNFCLFATLISLYAPASMAKDRVDLSGLNPVLSCTDNLGYTKHFFSDDHGKIKGVATVTKSGSEIDSAECEDFDPSKKMAGQYNGLKVSGKPFIACTYKETSYSQIGLSRTESDGEVYLLKSDKGSGYFMLVGYPTGGYDDTLGRPAPCSPLK